MDLIKIGLDFGTHQTKICVQRTPDEGHGEPKYEFFTFSDLFGNKNYFLPSVVQINNDNTLSYGYVDEKRIKKNGPKPQFEGIERKSDFDIEVLADELYDKYERKDYSPEDKQILIEMLSVRKKKLLKTEEIKLEEARRQYESLMNSFEGDINLLRNFKQATFIDGEWNNRIPSKMVCVWYLAYVIFLLEEKFGTDFSLNMGIPADDNTFLTKKILAIEILTSAYHLVEAVFRNDKEAFLRSTLEELNEQTLFIKYSPQFENDYFFINIFPEAYASLIGLTSRGKLSMGMNLTVDVGGGTTDISFFTIQGNQPDRPVIYKYWSIPQGLNYIAKKSGFDYAKCDFEHQAIDEIIKEYNNEKLKIVGLLINKLFKLRKGKNVLKSALNAALRDRIIVYSGGGSTFEFLNTAIHSFTDIMVIDEDIWKNENIKNKAKVSELRGLLTTAYGLSVCNEDEDVKIEPLDSLLSHITNSDTLSIQTIDKDMC